MTEHPQLFEALPQPVDDALRASIKRFGMLVPVAVDQDRNIIDGRHRLRIAKEVGAQAHYTVITITDQDQADEIQRSLNADRRHLSGDRLREHILFLAQQVDDRGVGVHSQATIARVVGISQPYVTQVLGDSQHISTYMLPDRRKGADGKDRPANRPTAPPISDDELDELKPENLPSHRGNEPGESSEPDWTSSQPNIASASNEKEAEKAGKALSSVSEQSGQVLNSRAASQLAARERKPDPVTEPVELPDGAHRCIVIDPPWPVQKIEREERPDQGSRLDYATMPIECQSPAIVGQTIESRPDYESEDRDPIYVPCFKAWHSDEDGYDDGWEPCQSIECVVGRVLTESAHDDSHIYLWVTQRYLPDGLRLLESWGFSYQCVMTWRKNVGITPYSWMYDTEHVLFGRKGNLKLERLGMRLSFDAPTQGHSAKPDVFYDRVREASPGPRLDMFPGVEHDGFVPWGLEASHRAI